MRDVLGKGTILGYCTNVHAGGSLTEIEQNLDRYAVAVKRRVSPDSPLGVGLWFSAEAVNALALNEDEGDRVAEFGARLQKRDLLPYTINGFPYGNFHQPVVKHAVYKPDWSDPLRLAYTQNLAIILHRLLPEGAEGSISTVPIGWKGAVADGWSHHLLDMVEFLAQMEQDTGRLIHLDLEPEPGCEMGDTMTWFTLMGVIESIGRLPGDLLRRHLRVCHDICHAAVMFEKPTMMLERCRESGFRIGKVQISSAVRAPFANQPKEIKAAMRAQLETFAEPRYLHQTTVGRKEGNALTAFYDDLPHALAQRKASGHEWRVHFHVPVHLETLGHLGTTQAAITEFLGAVRPEDEIRHFEVETYAWNVLPDELKVADLADGIARELAWVRDEARKLA